MRSQILKRWHFTDKMIECEHYSTLKLFLVMIFHTHYIFQILFSPFDKLTANLSIDKSLSRDLPFFCLKSYNPNYLT